MISRFDILWPGSMPTTLNNEVAQRLLLSIAGQWMHYVPPQEPPDWIVPLLLKLREHPDLEVVREGDWSDYKHQLRLRIKKGHEFRQEYIDVGIATSTRENMATYLRLTRELGLRDTAYQVSVKGVFDFAFFAFGPGAINPLQAGRYITPFLQATAREMQAAYERVAPYVPMAFQLEVPAETVLACTLRGLRRPFLGWLARAVTQLAECVPQGARCGVHLCYGDLGHKALVAPRTLAPVVALANAIAKNWPADTPLNWMHIPMASGENTPPLRSRFYAPLSRLRLPDTCQVAAGFFHEDLSPSQLRMLAAQVIYSVDQANIPSRLALAPSCGCGRRSEAATQAVLRQAKTLCTATDPFYREPMH